MPMFATISEMLRSQPTWRKADLLDRWRPQRLTEIEQDEEHCLDAMVHWRDPAERLRRLHCRRHALVDDNPASG
jgi:hypothetical protein